MTTRPTDCTREEWVAAKQLAREALANLKFQALSPAKKRVVIAKDVLKWLATGKLIAAGRGGSEYLRIITPGTRKEDERGYPIEYGNSISIGDAEWQTPVVNGYQCVACGIGGLVAAAAERDACSLVDDEGGSIIEDSNGPVSGIAKALEGLFSKDQLLLIERAYERGIGIPFPSSIGDDGLAWSARYFVSHLEEPSDRLVAIMKNIIANKGTFAPPRTHDKDGYPIPSRVER